MSTPATTPAPRVAFFIPSIDGGGVERNLVVLCQYFLAHAHAVDVLFAQASPLFLRQLPPGVRLVQLNRLASWPAVARLLRGRVQRSLAGLPDLLRYLASDRPDTIISMQSSSLLVYAWRLAGKPCALIVRESNTPTAAVAELGARAGLITRLKRWSYPLADALVANSEGAAADLARTIGVSPSRIHVIYNPTGAPSLQAQAAAAPAHPWFQPDALPVVLGIGRLVAQKNFVQLLAAFALVRASIPARLVILGEGPERAALEAQARRLGIAADVWMPGFTRNPYQYLARAAVFVLASRYEGLPNVLIEATALGVPIAAFDCPSGPREILLDGGAGLLIPPDDVPGLAHAIALLLSNRTLARQLATEGKAQSWRFSPEAGGRQYVALAEHLRLQKKAHP